MRILGPILCGDGHPIFGMLLLQERDREYKSKSSTPFNGGFYTILYLYKMRGKLFGPAHMQEIWKACCPSIAQLNWVMCPGDPNQVDDKLIWYYFALNTSAILALWSEHVTSGDLHWPEERRPKRSHIPCSKRILSSLFGSCYRPPSHISPNKWCTSSYPSN